MFRKRIVSLIVGIILVKVFVSCVNPDPCADGHTWSIIDKATCIKPGLMAANCAICDEPNPNTTIPIDPEVHDFTEWQTTREPGATENRIDTEKCSHCSKLSNKTYEFPFTFLGNLDDYFFEAIYENMNQVAWRIIRAKDPPTEVFIPAYRNGFPVTIIGDDAFSDTQLTAVTIGNRVTIIGNFAFFNNQLSNVTIPNSVISIGYWTFRDNQLTSITIPDSVTSIGWGTFAGNRLTQITIPTGITTIEGWMFSDNQLTSVIIPDNVTSIGEWAFMRNHLVSATIGNNVITIGQGAFEYNQLTNLSIGNSVTTIVTQAFRMNQLTSVVIPDSVTIIRQWAFLENRLTSITIGANVQLSNGASFPSFGHGFEDFYNNNDRLAGTYTRPNITSTVWNRQN